VVRIQADTADVEEFLDRYSRYFGAEVVFLPTEGIQPPGRLVRFVFALADGCEMICGEGVVLRMRRDTGDPLRPPGMELRYFILDEGSQRVVDDMLARRTGTLTPADPPPYEAISLDLPEDKTVVRAVIPPLERVKPSRPLRIVVVGTLVGMMLVLGGLFGMRLSHKPAKRVPLDPSTFGIGGGGPGLPATTRSAPQAGRSESPPLVPFSIDSTPPHATVRIDGERRGETPLALSLSPGPHQIELERSRWAPLRRTIDAPAQVALELERPRGKLQITSTPSAARVRIDDQDVGITPVELEPTAFEQHVVQVSFGDAIKRRHVYLKPGSAISVALSR